VLTSMGAFLKVKRKLYWACIKRVFEYASETLAMKVEDTSKLRRMERMMVRWMCSVHLKSITANAELGIDCITDVRRSRMQWFSRVERKTVMIGFQHMEVLKLNEVGEWALVRVRWRGLICRNVQPEQAWKMYVERR